MSARVTPGLFGKLPAHGDFVRRGWGDATVAALDDWCTQAVASLGDAGDAADDDGAGVRLWVPAGTLGPAALHLAVGRTRDRAGRAFVLAVGVDGADAWAHALAAGDALAAVLRRARGGEGDADATLAAVAATVAPVVDGHAAPSAPRWWRGADMLATTTIDAATLAGLLRGRVAA